MDTRKIGEFLKELRKEKGLTQENLAEILLVSGRTVSRWETGTNMPELSILIRLAEFYEVDIKEILDGERKKGMMDKELKETLSKVADYNKLEKEKAVKAGNTAFGLTFAVCAAVIIVELLMTGRLTIVIGETLTLLTGGILYIAMMLFHGVWETGSGFKNTPFNNFLTSIICSGIFSAILAFYSIRSGANPPQAVRFSVVFFIGITIISYAFLRILARVDSKRHSRNI